MFITITLAFVLLNEKRLLQSNVFQLNIVRDILECIQSLKNAHETNEN